MKIFLNLLIIVLILAVGIRADLRYRGNAVHPATSEPVCGYVNSQGERVFLKYFPLSKKGEDYVDFESSGKCVKRAYCTENYETKVENCSDYNVHCENLSHYHGVFPACCTKC
uniref:Single domain-containing protein n=1 Tax=Glossina brevipalpis TaxID=37001 RepID=A0A1A9WF93_9MUSC